MRSATAGAGADSGTTGTPCAVPAASPCAGPYTGAGPGARGGTDGSEARGAGAGAQAVLSVGRRGTVSPPPWLLLALPLPLVLAPGAESPTAIGAKLANAGDGQEGASSGPE